MAVQAELFYGHVFKRLVVDQRPFIPLICQLLGSHSNQTPGGPILDVFCLFRLVFLFQINSLSHPIHHLIYCASHSVYLTYQLPSILSTTPFDKYVVTLSFLPLMLLILPPEQVILPYHLVCPHLHVGSLCRGRHCVPLVS